MKNLTILLLLSLSFGTVTDIDGNTYETIQIGEQLWMAENLKTTKYKDGSEIPNITNNGEWSGLSTGAYSDYDNNPANSETYGRLYNWYTVDDDKGVCPEGWHVPDDAEYIVLIDYLGGTWYVAGGKAKEAGYEHWNSPNTGATNESGFTGLPAGYRDPSNGFFDNGDGDGDAFPMGNRGYFWSSSHNSSSGGKTELRCTDSNFSGGMNNKHTGFSIRCLRDEDAGCTDPEACNYDETATANDGSCEYEYDCAGTCGGDLEPDCCGVCGGDNSQCSNCCGSPFYEDCSDDCAIDLNGECCYELEVDECGVCGGDGTDCNGDGIPDDCEEVYNEGYTTGFEDGIDSVHMGNFHNCIEDCPYYENMSDNSTENEMCQFFENIQDDSCIQDCDLVAEEVLNDSYSFCACTQFGSQTECENAGCTWDDDCLEYDNEVDCLNEGCNWNGESCYEENIGNGEDSGYTCIYDADEGSDDCEEVYTAGLEEGILIGGQSGDANGDGVLNILDIVYFIDVILNP